MQNSLQSLVILDRDGVINRDSDEYIKSPDEWQPLRGSIEAIGDLKRAGYLVAVGSNQSGIARGLFDLDTLSLIHEKMLSLIRTVGGDIDALLICPHGPMDHCDCRKPKPGLMFKIAGNLNIPLNQAYVVGDSLRDLQAAVSAGAKPILVKTGNGMKTLKQIAAAGEPLSLTPTYTDLKHFTDSLLKRSGDLTE